MPENNVYRNVSGYGNALNPGVSIRQERRIGFNSELADLSPLISKGIDSLSAERENSVAKEQAIYERFTAAADEWVVQGGRTLMIDKALEYLRTPEIKHTSNKWTVTEKGFAEISNRVYRMAYNVYQETPKDKSQSPGDSGVWCVSWAVIYNVREETAKANHSSAYTIAGEDKKRFRDKAKAEQYAESCAEAYASLFTELSPPVPEDKKYLFSVNGVLLPGYTLAERQPTPDELLDFLDDFDVIPEKAVEKAPEQKALAHDRKKIRPGRAR